MGFLRRAFWEKGVHIGRKGFRKRSGRSGKVYLEQLEPRLLLSADLTYSTTAGAHDLTLRTADVQGVETLQLINNGDANGDTRIVASQALADTTGVVITGSDIIDRLFVDLSHPSDIPVTFSDSTSGDNDVLTVAGGDHQWDITGRDSGTAAGICFSGIENLEGGQDNKDTFVLERGGSITGHIDGGVGGFDTLRIEGPYGRVSFSADGPDSGSIALDDGKLDYAGLEPITLSGAADIIVSGSSGNDKMMVTMSGTNIIVSATGTMESVSFAAPTHSLSIIGGTGTDSIEIASGLSLAGINLGLSAEQIRVDTGVAVTAGLIEMHADASAAPSPDGLGMTMGSSLARILIDGATLTGTSIILDVSSSVTATDTSGSYAYIDVDSLAEVGLTGASRLNAAGNVAISATSSVTVDAESKADASSGDRSLDAAVSIVLADTSALAHISDGTVFTVGGALDLSASNTAVVTTTADGTFNADSKGGTVAFTHLGETTKAFIDGTSSGSAGSIDMDALSDASATTTAKSAPGGKTKSSAAGEARPESEKLLEQNQDKAQTSDGSLTFAAAVAISDLTESNEAYISAGTITSAGDVTLNATASTTAVVKADASRTSDATGVGVAVAINSAAVTDQAYVASTLSARSLDIEATTPDGTTNTFSAEAISGAGAQDTGVAGSLAFNMATVRYDASLKGTANVTLTGDAAANLSATASNTETAGASAKAKTDTGPSTGVGASVALNIVTTATKAQIEDGAALTGAHDLALSAKTTPKVTTKAEAGAAGSDTAVGGAFALTIDNTTTLARVGTTTVAGGTTIAGSLNVSAKEEQGLVTTTADGTAAGAADVGVGVAIALTLGSDVVRATTERELKAQASAASLIEALAANRIETTAKASSKGAENKPGEDTSKKQTDKQRTFASGKAPAGTDTKSGKDTDQSTSDGSVGVAAAIAVNLSDVTAQAAVLDDVSTAGSLTVHSSVNGDAVVKADGSATVMPTKTVAFDPGATGVVDDTADTITIGASGFKAGDPVVYHSGAGTAIGGLTDGATYYVIAVPSETTKVKLAASADDAKDSKAIDLTSGATGSGHTLAGPDRASGTGVGVAVGVNLADVSNRASIGDDTHRPMVSMNGLTVIADMATRDAKTFDAAAVNVVDASADTIAVGTNSFKTGDQVRYSKGAAGNTVIDGLTDGRIYYIIAVEGDATKIKLAASAADAKKGTAVDLKGAGTGTQSLSDQTNTLSTQATSGAGAPETSVAGSLGLNVVSSTAEAYVVSGSSVNANGGDVALSAVNTVFSSAVATSKSDDGTKTGIGASVALTVAPVVTRGEIEDGVAISGAKALSVSAATAPTITTSAVAGTGGDSFSLGGAVALTFGDTTTTARVGSASGTTILSGGLTVKATEENGTVMTTADGTAAGKDVGIGAAVALNLGTDAARATTERAISAGDKVSIEAKAASASETTGKASVKGGEKKKSEDKTFEGTSSVVNTSTDTIAIGANTWKTGDAVQYSAGGGTAIGGLTEGKTYYIISTGDPTRVKLAGSVAHAKAGTAVDLTGTGSGAKQSLRQTEDKTFEGASAVDTSTDTIALGTSKWKTGDAVQYSAGGGANIGGLKDGTTYYIIATGDPTTVKLATSAVNARMGIAIDLTSTGSGAKQGLKQTSQAQTDKQADFGKEKAAPKGTDTKDGKKTTQDTSDGPVGVAAAIAVNITDVIADAAVLADLATTGDLAIHSSANGDAIVKADGSAVVKANKDSSSGGSGGSSNSGDGIGVGIGVNLADVVNTAHIGDAAHTPTVSSRNLTITADMASRNNESGPAHTLTTQAIAGAGAPEVGVAGAVAINLVSSTTAAFIEGGSTINTHGNDLSLTAVNTASTSAVATSKSDDGTKTGIGASVALNITPIKTRAEIEDNVTLADTLHNLSLSATTTPTVLTKAEAGAAGDSFSLGGAVAITIDDTVTVARIGTTADAATVTSLTGGSGGVLTVKAYEEKGSVTTSADASAAGNDVGIGAAIAINLSTDAARATTERIINASGSGASTIEAKADARSTTTSKASVKGEKKEQSSDKDTSKKQTDQQRNYGSSKAQSGTDTKSGKDNDQSSSDGPVGVAAAVAVNIADVTADAAVLANLTTGGALTVASSANGDGIVKADGSAVVMPTRKLSFNPTVTDSTATGYVDATADTIKVGAYNWKQGDPIKYSKGTGTDAKEIGGLTDGQTYYVIVVDGDATKIKLAASADDAKAKKAIDLTSGAAGTTHTFTGPDRDSGYGIGVAVGVNLTDVANTAHIGDATHTPGVSSHGLTISADMASRGKTINPTVTDDKATGYVDVTADTILVGKNEWKTGDALTYSKGDDTNTAIGRLQDGKTYYVITTSDATKIKLAASADDAKNGTAIDLLTGASGTNHRLFEKGHTLTTTAIAGAGAPEVGVAGAVAVNIVGSTTEAYMKAGTSVNANGGDVSINAVNTATASAVATSKAETGTKGDGIGASVAVNIVPITTRSEIEDNAVLTHGRDLSLAATTTPTVLTKAEAGASGDSFSLGGAVAITVAETTTTARIGVSGTLIDLSGKLAVRAGEENGTITTTADGTVAGSDVAIGAAVALNLSTDTVRATTERTINAAGAGDSTVEAKAVVRSETTAKASVKGEKAKGDADKDKSGAQTQEQRDFANEETAQKSGDKPDTKDSKDGKQETSDGPVGIAASIAVNIADVVAEAAVVEDITTGGLLSVHSSANGDAIAVADSSAVMPPKKFVRVHLAPSKCEASKSLRMDSILSA